MRNMLLVITAFVLGASQAHSREVDVYRCLMTKKANLISEELVFVHDAKRNEYLVEDGVIHFVEGNPIPAKVKENSSKKLVLTWSVLLPDRSGTIARLNYRLAFFKSNSRVLVSVQAMGYTNQSNGRGSCRKSKVKV